MGYQNIAILGPKPLKERLVVIARLCEAILPDLKNISEFYEIASQSLAMTLVFKWGKKE